jgi:hypothetical protein
MSLTFFESIINEVHFNRRIGPATLKKLFHGYYKRLMASGVNGIEVGLAICVKIRFEPINLFRRRSFFRPNLSAVG